MKGNVFIFGLLKLAAVFVVSLLLGTLVYTLSESRLVFEAGNVSAIWIVMMILALQMKINYSGLLFILNMVFATVLVSFYPFGQGLIITLLMIWFQRLLKLL